MKFARNADKSSHSLFFGWGEGDFAAQKKRRKCETIARSILAGRKCKERTEEGGRGKRRGINFGGFPLFHRHRNLLEALIEAPETYEVDRLPCYSMGPV